MYTQGKKYFFINTKYSIVFLFYIYARKKYFFINTKYSIVFVFYICKRKKIFFLSTQNNSISLLYMHKKKCFYQHKILNSISLLSIRKKIFFFINYIKYVFYFSKIFDFMLVNLRISYNSHFYFLNCHSSFHIYLFLSKL